VTRRIDEFVVPIDSPTPYHLGPPAKVLSVAAERFPGAVSVYVLVDDDEEPTPVIVRFVMAGDLVEDGEQYIGTVQLAHATYHLLIPGETT
jgi:hypothetical protein